MTGTAHAASTGGSQPAYPGSKVAISVAKTQRAGSVVTVKVSGANEPFDENRPDISPGYIVDVFVQDRSALPTCPTSYRQALDNVVNLGPRSISQIARSTPVGSAGPFSFGVKYRSVRTPRRVVYCAYTRLTALDDAAYAQLRHTLVKPKRR